METRTYQVEGMTCQHCVNSVSAEINKLDGIGTVVVDLAGKTVTVSANTLDDKAICAAVGEAGYRVISQS